MEKVLTGAYYIIEHNFDLLSPVSKHNTFARLKIHLSNISNLKLCTNYS